MRRLNRNYWRLGWVLLTNGGLTLSLLTGPLRVHHDTELLYATIRMATPQFSYWRELFIAPWVPVLALILLLGIVAELRRTVFSSILNMTPYLAWLSVALWDRTKFTGEVDPQELFLNKLLLIILTMVVVTDLIFYLAAFRRTAEKSPKIGFSSHI
jgi:hypothetical protein